MYPQYRAPVGNQGPYVSPYNQTPHTNSYSAFLMHGGTVPSKNPMPYGGPNTENGPLNDSVVQMPNQSAQVQSVSVPPTSLVVNNQAKLSDMEEIISTLNSETTCLESSLKDCVLRHKSLQIDLQVFESDKQNLSEQSTAKKERFILVVRSKELHLQQVDSQQADPSLKKTTIDDQNKSIEELKVRISGRTLTQNMDEISLIADEGIEEMGMLNNEKSKLLEELNKTKDLLQEKEKELADMTLLVKEHINCSQNIENLMEGKESLTQENHQLHSLMSAANNTQHEMKILMTVETILKFILAECCETISSLYQNEPDNFISALMWLLLNSINSLKKEILVTKKMTFFSDVMLQLVDLLRIMCVSRNSSKPVKELAHMTLLAKEHINCSQNIENLMEGKESLTQENHQLHSLMSAADNTQHEMKRLMIVETILKFILAECCETISSLYQNEPDTFISTLMWLLLNSMNSLKKEILVTKKMTFFSDVVFQLVDLLQKMCVSRYSSKPLSQDPFLQENGGPRSLNSEQQLTALSKWFLERNACLSEKHTPFTNIPHHMHARYLPSSLVCNITQSNVPSSTAATQFSQASNTLLPQNRMGSLPQPPAAQKRRLDPYNMPSPLSQNMNAMCLSQNQNHPLLTANTHHHPANSFPQPPVSQPPRLPHNSGTMYNHPPGQFIPNSNADNYSVPPQRNTGYVDRTMLPHKQPNQSNKISNQDIYPPTNQANKPPPYNSNGTGFVPPVSQYGHLPNSGMHARYPSLVPNITQSNVPSSTGPTQFNQASNTLLSQNRMGFLPQPPAAQKRRLDPHNMPSPISCSTTDTNSISDCDTSSESMPSPLYKRKCVSQDPFPQDFNLDSAPQYNTGDCTID